MVTMVPNGKWYAVYSVPEEPERRDGREAVYVDDVLAWQFLSGIFFGAVLATGEPHHPTQTETGKSDNFRGFYSARQLTEAIRVGQFEVTR